MALESEIKLSLPPDAAKRVAAHPLLAAHRPLRQKLSNIYYDTPDLNLLHQRVAVRHRRKGTAHLLTVKSATASTGGLAQRNEWEIAAQPGEFDFSHVDDDLLRQRLESARARLTAVFSTDFTRTAWLLDTFYDGRRARVEIALDRGWIVAGTRRQAICELEIELIDGEVQSLFSVARALQADLPLHPETFSKAERGYRLFTGTPTGAAKAGPIDLAARNTSIGAFKHIAFSCLSHLQGNEQGLRESDAPEFVHQARVAIRRLRTAMRVWRPLLPDSFCTTFDPQWRALAGTLGEARNWDIFVHEMLPSLDAALPDRRGSRALHRRARHRLAAARKNARGALASADYSRLLLDFTATTIALPDGGEPSLVAFARRNLKLQAKKTDRLMAGALNGDAATRHRLRIAAKRLRYALEFFATLFPGDGMARYHSAICRLLEVLGQLNDHATAEELARQLLAENRSGLPGGWPPDRSERLLRDLPRVLDDFIACRPPWQRH